MTNAHEQLEALWQLSDEGRAEWWARSDAMGPVLRREESPDGDMFWLYWSAWCDPQHALDLVTCEAERWLVGKGWGIFKSGPYTKYTPPRLAAGFDIFESIPEALAYANRENTPPA